MVAKIHTTNNRIRIKKPLLVNSDSGSSVDDDGVVYTARASFIPKKKEPLIYHSRESSSITVDAPDRIASVMDPSRDSLEINNIF